MIGLPVSATIDSAAPPRASPSSLVSTTAVVADAVEERLRGRHRVLADHRVDDEQHLVRVGGVPDGRGLGHHVGVDAQPAGGVDDDHVRAGGAAPRPATARATATGSPTPLPGSGAYTGTPARSPTTCSCWTAFGRCRSAGDQQRGVALLLQPQRELGRERRLTGALQAGQHDHGRRDLGEPQPPGLAAQDRRSSSSCTILMTCWAGLSAAETSSPVARSLTRAMNCRTTGSATSASSSAMRISRAVASMSAADSRPLPRSEEKTCVSRSDSVSNTKPRVPATRA